MKAGDAKRWTAEAKLGAAADLPCPAVYTLLILREYGEDPEVAAALLEGTGIRPEHLASPDAEITLAQQLRGFLNAARVLPPGWSLELGSRLHASTHGAIGLASVSAATLAEALDINVRFATVRAPAIRWRSEETDTHHLLVLEDRFEAGVTTRTLTHEMVLLTVQGLIESVLGRPMREAAIELGYEAPPYAARYADYFHASYRFGCERTAMHIPKAWLPLRSPHADPALLAASLRKLELLERRLQGGDTLLLRVEAMVAARAQTPSLEEAAAQLGMSTRTLVRRLAAAGTTFSDVVDTQRKARAEVLLRDATLDAAEIAYRLGYEDPASFGRACRRWFGMAPGRLRHSLLRRQ